MDGEELFGGSSFGMELFSTESDTNEGEGLDLNEINVEEGAEEVKTPVAAKTEEEKEAKEETNEGSEPEKEEGLSLEEINAEETEEEEEETEEKTKSKKKSSPDSEGENDSPITPFASFLQEKGFLPNIDMDKFSEAENPLDALADAMQEELKIANTNFINAFPPELIDMAKAVAQGVPFDALQGAKKDEINYSKITEDSLKGEDNVDLQRRIATEGLLAKGFNEKKVARMVERLEDAGDLEEEALEYKDELVERAKKRQEKAKADFEDQQAKMSKQQEEYVAFIGQTVDKTEEIIPGIKMTKGAKDKLYNGMTQMVAKDHNGNPMNATMAARAKDPVKFDLAVTYLTTLTSGFTDWSKIKTSAKSSAAKDLEKTLSKASTEHTYGKAKKGVNASGDAADDLMASLTKRFGGQ